MARENYAKIAFIKCLNIGEWLVLIQMKYFGYHGEFSKPAPSYFGKGNDDHIVRLSPLLTQ